MQKLTLLGVAAAMLTTTAFGQDSSVTSSSSSVTKPGTCLSEAGAISWILVRVSPEEGRALLRTLMNLENRGAAGDASHEYGLMSTAAMILDNAGDDRSTVESVWNNFSSFDRESYAILARDAYFGGIDDGGARGVLLNAFLNDPGLAPYGKGQVPEHAILDGLCIYFDDANAQTLRDALATLEKKGLAGGYRNFGYINAKNTLMEVIPADRKDAFVAAWQRLAYSEREAVCTLVRDACLGGIDDL